MKKLLLLFTLSFTAFISRAQKPEMAQAIAHYKFSHVRDTLNRDKPYTENMVLFLGPTSSVYKSYDKKLQDALMKKQMAEQLAAQKGANGPMTFRFQNGVLTTRAEIYQFPVQKKMVRKETQITAYLIEEPLPVIKWKISSDTASFGTLHCQKATGHFGGRDYTAWFSTEVPFHAGPWKLNGLPGLIVEAYDTKKDVMFKFDGLDEVDPTQQAAAPNNFNNADADRMIKIAGMDDGQNPNLISLPADAVKTTDAEFKNLQEAMRKDPNAALGAAGGRAGMPALGSAGGPPRAIAVSEYLMGSRVINNPLELPEKK